MSKDPDDNVIHNFSERRNMEQALRALADVPNAYERERQARALAEHGTAIIPAFVNQLEMDHPGMRGGLGLLAQYLDRQAIIAALRRVAADVKRSPVARVNAITILERYLDEDIDVQLAPDMQTARIIARQNAEEALRLAENQPLVLMEYAEQLLDEPLEIVYAVVRVISDLEDPNAARLLAAIASRAPAGVVRMILHRLGTQRDTIAYESLSILAHLLPDELAAYARRQMRKLRMAGISLDEDNRLRCLWSPTSSTGQSMMWFIRQGTPTGHKADLLLLVLHPMAGVITADASPDIPLDELPYPAPVGHEHRIRLQGAARILYMAEISPGQGLDLLHQALRLQHDNETLWPDELAVFGHWLWAQPLYDNQPPSSPKLPDPSANISEDEVKQLLAHPAFADWAWELSWNNATWQQFAPDQALQWNSSAHQAAISILLQDDVRQALHSFLKQQALWLSIVEQRDLAAVAASCAHTLLQANAEHPFVQHFAFRSLLTAAADRAARTPFKLLK